MSLVTSDWLENKLDKVRLIDCSWHMPNVKRNGYEEYLKEHIDEQKAKLHKGEAQ